MKNKGNSSGGREVGSVQEARVSFLPIPMRSALHLALLQVFHSRVHDEAGMPSGRTQAVLPTFASSFEKRRNLPEC